MRDVFLMDGALMRVSLADVGALIRFLAILTSRKAARSVNMDVVDTGMVLGARWDREMLVS